MANYRDLDTDRQAEAMLRVASRALSGFGLDDHRAELVLHEYNTTCRVDGIDGSAWAVRVNTNSKATPANIRAQQQWLTDVAQRTPLRVPVPLRATSGDWFVEVDSDEWGGRLRVTAASWLSGGDCGDLTPHQARLLGRVMATLHGFAHDWTVPARAGLPRFDAPLLGDRDRLTGMGTPRQQDVVRLAMATCTWAFTEATRLRPTLAIHADLHGGNLSTLR